MMVLKKPLYNLLHSYADYNSLRSSAERHYLKHKVLLNINSLILTHPCGQGRWQNDSPISQW